MSGATANFTDGSAYERFMGRWSRLVGDVFLRWLAPPRGALWLDVGCGTGAFTESVLDLCSPAGIVGVDPFAEQIEYARKLPTARRAEFKVADALNLPFADGSFDVVASALVINFLPDRPRGLAEMRRVAKSGGLVAGYVWDFAGGRGLQAPLIKSMRAIGIEPPVIPGAKDSSVEALKLLFGDAGFQEVETRPIEISASYRDFDDFWTSLTPVITPLGKFIASLAEPERARIRNSAMSILPSNPDGSIGCLACANAIKARVPD